MLRSALVLLLLCGGIAKADLFDRLTNMELNKLVKAEGQGPVTELTANQLTANAGRIPGVRGTLLVLQTRDGRFAKLDVQLGMQKIGPDRVPMMLIDRFITFKPGDDRTVVASGNNTQLFSGLQFNADLGQVVPRTLPGDLELTGGPDMTTLKLRAVGSAKIHLITTPPIISNGPSTKFVMGEQFEPRFFVGTYKLHDDGRRSGSLTLEADESLGTVTGTFYSDKDGRKYEVTGKLGPIRHQVQFTIAFPQSKQQYHGFMFTGDGRAIAGTSKYQDRETGFYAVRMEGDAK